MAALFAFLPDEVLILIPLGLGILVMLKILSVGRAMGMLFVLIAIIASMPFVASIFDFLPVWVLLLLLIFFGYSLVKTLTGAAFGRGVRDHFFGNILYGIFLIPFRIMRWVFLTIFRRVRT